MILNVPLVSSCLLAFALVNGAAVTHLQRDEGEAPKATIYPSTGNGQGIEVNGVFENGLDYYLNIPYAEPPVGELRFAQPQAKVYNTTSIDAKTFGPACIQQTGDFGFGNIVGNYGISEDCLTLNVYTPPGSAGNDFLPVVFYIPGGGYFTGTPSTYNGTDMLLRGIEADQKVIYVSVSYRVGVFGFPAGQDFVDAGSANNGIRDVMLALQWVQENIQQFGGDPSKVTVMGQSAGAGIISMLYLNEDINLFRSAVIMSGSPVLGSFVPGITTLFPNATETFYQLAGCPANATQGASALDCLRNQSTEAIYTAQANTSAIYAQTSLFGPIVDGDVIPDSPFTMLDQGRFARYPLIISDVVDEGTLFIDLSVNTTDAFYLAVTGGKNDSETQTYAEDIFRLYPDDPSEGSPFGTGNDTFGSPPTLKRYAAYLGDNIFQAGRRAFARYFQKTGSPIWSYTYAQYAPKNLNQTGAEAIGAFHGVDVGYLLGLFTNTTQLTSEEETLRLHQTQYMLNFITNTDPNQGYKSGEKHDWPQYGEESNMLYFKAENITVITDTYREEALQVQYDNQAAGFVGGGDGGGGDGA